MYGNNVRTTETDTNFVANYTEKTRLGFIGTRDSQRDYYSVEEILPSWGPPGIHFSPPSLLCAPCFLFNDTLLSFSLSFVY